MLKLTKFKKNFSEKTQLTMTFENKVNTVAINTYWGSTVFRGDKIHMFLSTAHAAWCQVYNFELGIIFLTPSSHHRGWTARWYWQILSGRPIPYIIIPIHPDTLSLQNDLASKKSQRRSILLCNASHLKSHREKIVNYNNAPHVL